jgi:hypothetical protein
LAGARAAAAGDLTVARGGGSRAAVRAAAARAAGSLGSTAMLDQLAGDPSALVRESVPRRAPGATHRQRAALLPFPGDPSTAGAAPVVLEPLARSPLARSKRS